MEAEQQHLGPLSYDLTAPTSDADPAKAVVFAVVLALGMLVVGLVGSWLALGVVAKDTWFVTGVPLLTFALPLALAYRLTRKGLRRTRLRALAALALVLVFAAYLSHRSIDSIKPALPQVRYSLDSLHVPPGFTKLDETSRGDRFCRHDGCPRIDRRYRAPAADPDPVKTFILSMFDQGWERTSDVAPDQATTAAKNGLTAQLAAADGILRITVVRDS